MPSTQPTVSTASIWRLAIVLLLVTPTMGCGPASLAAFLADGGLPYAKRCAVRAEAQRKAVESLQYNATQLRVHRWPGASPADERGRLGEDAFVEAVARGQVRNTLIVARGGVGKSTFARAIEGYLCGRLSVFRVDLNGDVAARLGRLKRGENAIVTQCERQLKLTRRVTDREVFHELLKSGDFVVLLDSLDEVPVSVRARVLAQVEDLRARYPKTARLVTFARPAVFRADYGLNGLDSKLEIPPLTCGRSASTLKWTAKDDKAAARVGAFVSIYRLDQRRRNGRQCYHPYMATYRDIQVIQRLSKDFDPTAGMGGLPATLSTVHQRIVGERLRKELAALDWTQERMLKTVDAMVRFGGLKAGDWNLSFDIERCLKSLDAAGSKASERRYVCEKVLQSAIFEPFAGAGKWRFGHRDIAELFLARWLDGEVAKRGCRAVKENAGWLASKAVAGYLVGQPQGRKCLVEVSRVLCAANGFARNDVELLYKGLPLGAERRRLLKKAAAKLPRKRRRRKRAQGVSACMVRTLQSF